LEIVYDLDAIAVDVHTFQDRPHTIWRYHEFLPLNDPKYRVELGAGGTTLHHTQGLADTIGIKNLYVKDDTVNPTYSFKDRPSAVAVSKALEFGSKAVGCASTGNLAGAVAAHAAKAKLPCYVFIPFDIEPSKVLQATTYGAEIIAVEGTYDETNRFAAQVAQTYHWALANINMRPYYVEGSKTLAFEICEQLAWDPPDNIVIPVGSGALLCAIGRGLREFQQVGLIPRTKTRLIGVQPEGCAPIATAFKTKAEDVDPIEYPDTLAKSLAIGDPGDGIYTLQATRNSGGSVAAVSDQAILDAIRLLGKTEGIFAEPAGAVTVAALQSLVDQDVIATDETTVCLVTGNGFKAADTLTQHIPTPTTVKPTLEAFAKTH
jgi:threonine synthase